MAVPFRVRAAVPGYVLPTLPVPPSRTAPAAETAAPDPLRDRSHPTVPEGVGAPEEDATELHGGAPAHRGAGDGTWSGAHDAHDRQHEGEPR